MTKLRLTFPILIALLALPAYAGTSSTAGLPNPSAESCTQVGGTYRNYTTPRGEDALCRLGRAEIGAWTLWEATAAHKMTTAAEIFLKHPPFQTPSYPRPPVIGMPNPSSVYCRQVSGQLEIVSDAQGNEFGMCGFPDGSEIEEWTLFNGPDAADQEPLARILRHAAGA